MRNQISTTEKAMLGFIIAITLTSLAVKYLNNDLFVTVVITLRGKRPALFLGMTMLFGIVFFFGAGEEISWGQRIFDIQSTDFFQQHNTQGETNLHNLVLGGKKINKIVFGLGLQLVLLIYLLILTPLYKRNPGLKQFLDRLAVPIAKPYQVISYLAVIILLQGMLDDPKKGELVEFAGSFLFFINFAFPYNMELFRAESDVRA